MKYKLIIFTTLFYLLPVGLSAQFMNVEIDVEPEVETVVLQSLNFGQLIFDSGLQEVPLGSPNMGVFKVSAIRTQSLLLSLQFDSELTHSELENEAVIPMQLNANFTNVGIDSPARSEMMSVSGQEVVLEAPEAAPDATWSDLYIYVYGNINVGDIPTGIYNGNVVLTVVYE